MSAEPGAQGHRPLHPLWLVLASGLVGCFLLVQLGEPRVFSDNYLVAARRSLLDLKLYTSDRPPGMYLFYKLCGYDLEVVTWVQALLSATAFSVLGFCLGSELRSRTARIAALLVFPLGACAWNVAGWNAVLLTESLTFAQFALVYAGLVLVFRRGSWPRYGLLFAIALFVGFTRDQNTYVMVVLAFLVLIARVGWRQGPERVRLLVFTAAILGFGLLQSQLASQGRRHVFSLYNVLFQRILGEPAYERWFAEQGVPIELVSAARPHSWRGEWASSHGWALYLLPEYRPFHTWNIQAGKSCFAKFLISHPRYLLERPWRDRDQIASELLVDYTQPLPPSWITRFATAVWRFPLIWIGLPLALIYLVLWARGSATPVPLIFAALCSLGALLAYHADAMEVPRHCITLVFGLRCALFHAALCAMDVGMRLRSEAK